MFEVFSNPDFQLNLYAEALGVMTEVILITVVVSKILTYKEAKRWRPARLNVATKVVDVQRNLFNALHKVTDPDLQTNKKDHNIPEAMSQEGANHWNKSIIAGPMKPALDELKKMVEYNNSALDSVLMPLVSDFLIAAEVVLCTIKYMLDAYDPKNPRANWKFNISIPSEELRKMEEVSKTIHKHYPKIYKNKKRSEFEIFTTDELIELFHAAVKKIDKFQ